MKEISLLLVLFVMSVQTMFGFEHVYPVTAGIRWADEQYNKELNQNQGKSTKQQVSQKTSLIKVVPNFAKTFTEFEKNYRLFHSYNDSIFLDKDAYSEQWINIFARRAECFANMYQENNSNFDEVFNWFKGKNVPESSYDSLYYWTRRTYHDYVLDRGLSRELLEILIPHYEQTNDAEHLVFCYLCAGYADFQFGRMGETGAEQKSIENFEKAYNLGALHFADFKNPLNRYYTLAALTNLVIQHLQTGTRTFEQSHKLVTEFRALIARPEVQAVIKDDANLNEFAHWALEMYEMRTIVIYINRGIKDKKLFDRLYTAYQKRRDEMGDLRNLKNSYYARLDYDDLLVEASRGNISWNEALKRFQNLLAIDAPKLEVNDIKLHSLSIYHIGNLYMTYCQIVEHTSLSKEEKRSHIVGMLKRLVDVIGRLDNIHFPIEKGLIISNLATNTELLKYLDEKEKGDLLYHLMIVEQPVTHVHIFMVKDLATAITRTMIDRNATYFVGMPGFETEADVRQKSDSLIRFVEMGAYYHDLGKLFIPAIVNQSYRRLIDQEFDLIKMHPERANIFFDHYPDIAPYRDFALGHHKWFNGAGYPSAFDNRQSPSFQAINIVTIADCLDAATEYFERNYRRPKSFEEVIAEFEAQAGTRYDPAIVNCIIENPKLYKKLEQMVKLGRFQLFLELSNQIKNNSLDFAE